MASPITPRTVRAAGGAPSSASSDLHAAGPLSPDPGSRSKPGTVPGRHDDPRTGPAGGDPFAGFRPGPVDTLGDRLRDLVARWDPRGNSARFGSTPPFGSPPFGSLDDHDDHGEADHLHDHDRHRGHSSGPGRHLPGRPNGPTWRGGRPRWLATAVVIAVAAAVGWWLLRPPPAPVEAVLPQAGGEVGAGSGDAAGAASGEPTPGAGGAGEAAAADGGAAAGGAGAATEGTATTVSPLLVVQASGAVVRAGVYDLPPGSRVDDLVTAAGGLSPDADVDRVNLAAPVGDGERIWIPRRGEAEPPPVVAGGGAPSAAGGGAPPGSTGGGGPGGAAGGGPPSVVDLNTATAEELDTLPGVGPATATAIISHREANGAFSSVDELLDVRGIGEAKLEQIRPLVKV